MKNEELMQDIIELVRQKYCKTVAMETKGINFAAADIAFTDNSAGSPEVFRITVTKHTD